MPVQTLIEQARVERDAKAEKAWGELAAVLTGTAKNVKASGVLTIVAALGLPDAVVDDMQKAVQNVTDDAAYEAAADDAVQAAIACVRHELKTELLVKFVRDRRAAELARLEQESVAALAASDAAERREAHAREHRVRFPFLFYDRAIFPLPSTRAARQWYADEMARCRGLWDLSSEASKSFDTPAGLDPKFYADAIRSVAAAFPPIE